MPISNPTHHFKQSPFSHKTLFWLLNSPWAHSLKWLGSTTSLTVQLSKSLLLASATASVRTHQPRGALTPRPNTSARLRSSTATSFRGSKRLLGASTRPYKDYNHPSNSWNPSKLVRQFEVPLLGSAGMLNRYPNVKVGSELLVKLLRGQSVKPSVRAGNIHPKLSGFLKKVLKIKLFRSYLSTAPTSGVPNAHSQNLRTRQVSRKLSIRKKPYMFLGLKKLPTVLRPSVFKAVRRRFRSFSRQVIKGKTANVLRSNLNLHSDLSNPTSVRLKRGLRVIWTRWLRRKSHSTKLNWTRRIKRMNRGMSGNGKLTTRSNANPIFIHPYAQKLQTRYSSMGQVFSQSNAKLSLTYSTLTTLANQSHPKSLTRKKVKFLKYANLRKLSRQSPKWVLGYGLKSLKLRNPLFALRARSLRKVLRISPKRSLMARLLLARVFASSIPSGSRSETSPLLVQLLSENGQKFSPNATKDNRALVRSQTSRCARSLFAFQKIRSFWVGSQRSQEKTNQRLLKRKFLKKRKQLLLCTPKLSCQPTSNLLLNEELGFARTRASLVAWSDATSEPSLYTYLGGNAAPQAAAKVKSSRCQQNRNRLTALSFSLGNALAKVTDLLPLTFPMRPLYSLMFIASPFSFLTHMLASTSATSDIVRATRATRRYFKHLVFPDVNTVRASVFRRLNRQKLLFQARTRMTSVHFAKKNSRSKLSPLLHPYTKVGPSDAPTPGFQDSHLAGSFTNLWVYRKVSNLVRRERVPLVTPRIRRIRFKPGYGRIWRIARRSIKGILNLQVRYQYRLTPKLQKRYHATRKVRLSHTSFTLSFALMTARLVSDNWVLGSLLSSHNVYLNGSLCSNKDTRLFVNDFIQLAINLKFYIALRWIKTWSQQRQFKVRRIFYRKNRPINYYQFRKTPKLSKNLPHWFFDLQYTQGDIPKYFEVDYFSLSIFVIHDHLNSERWLPLKSNVYNPLTLNMYNWKYIT